jgi:hypothetical protein
MAAPSVTYTFINGQTSDGTKDLTIAALTATSGTFSGAVTGARFIVTGSTVPANGIYLSAANTLAFAANTTLYGSINSAGAWTIGATGGVQTHTLNALDYTINLNGSGVAGTATFRNGNNTASSSANVLISVAGSSAADPRLGFVVEGVTTWSAGIVNATSDKFSISQSGSLGTNEYMTISTAGVVTFPGQLVGKGTATNDSAAAGYIGEYVESVVSAATNYPAATVTWGNMTSISLSAGDWDVTGQAELILNGSTMASDAANTAVVVSIHSGTTTTDHVRGSNLFSYTIPSAAANRTGVVNVYRLSLASTTTVYFKLIGSYSAGNPQFQCRLSARRMR